MSDQSSPPLPKPKPGSLRDRIAAFEKSSTTAAPPPSGPAVRPKPAGFSNWKPKAPSPPSSPSASTENAPSTARTGGMSASDAKESITKGGSLKDRMAALQGKGAFGAPAPPTAPKPVVEKPKWKPPPVVHAPIDDGDQAGEDKPAASIPAVVERTLSPPVSVKSQDGDETPKPVAHGDDDAGHDGDDDSAAVEQDPEEEERQRRAAIAARMARLGGARVGMAPPVFGKKPPMPVRKPTHEETPKVEEVKPAEIPLPTSPEPLKPTEDSTSFSVPPTSPPLEPQSVDKAEPEITTSSEQPPVGESSESHSNESSANAAKNPLSMPVPAVPRRAGPPRKKPAKPSLPPPEAPEENARTDVLDEPTPSVTDTNIDTIPSLEAEPVSPISAAEKVTSVQEENTTPKPHGDEEMPKEAQVEKQSTENTSPLLFSSSLARSLSSGLNDEVIPSPPPSLAISPSAALSPARGFNSSSLDAAIADFDPSPSPLSPPVENSGEDFGIDVDQVELDEEVEEQEDVEIITEITQPASGLHVQEEHKADELADIHVEVPTQAQELDEEEEEAARKKRVADRIAKMGGVNPFALPPRSPQAKASSPEVAQSPEARLAPVETATISDQDDILASSVPLSTSNDLPPVQKGEESHVEREPTDKGEQPISSDEDDQYEDEVDDDEVPIASKEKEYQQYVQQEPKEGNFSETSAEVVGPPPPLPPMSTRPSVQTYQYDQEGDLDGLTYEQDDEESDYGEDSELPIHDTTSPLASPTVASAQATDHNLDSSSRSVSSPPRPAQPPRRLIPQTPQRAQSDDEEPETERAEEEEEQETDEEADERMAASHLFVPPPGGRGAIAIQSSDIRRGVSQDDEDENEDGDGSESDSPALPVPPTRRSVDVPAPGRTVSRDYEDDDDRDSENESDHDGRALPIPLRARESSSSSSAISQPGSPPPRGPPPSIPMTNRFSQARPPPPVSPDRLAPSVSVSGSEEILDEEEGDPIDPFFHSPSRQASSANLRGAAQGDTAAHHEPLVSAVAISRLPSPPTTSPPVRQQPEEMEAEEEDQEQLRRKTIAERMAKLGGIRFGAAPLPTPSRAPAPRPEEEEQQETHNEEGQEEPAVLSEEEEERARKERIAAKMAQMGGMRIGMMPMGMGLPPQRSHVLKEEKIEKPPPARAVPPPNRPRPPSAPAPPPPAAALQTHDTDSEYTASEDGVKVEAEESELEEVGYDEVKEQVQEETPPPVPSRSSRGAHRQDSSDKTVSPTRPPVPIAIPIRRSSVQTNRSTGSSSGISPPPPQRKSSSFMPQSEYVMVEEPESQEIPPPPPPARPVSRLPPARSTPSVPPPSRMTSDPTDISSQWELPSIPNASLDMDGGNDLSMSWTDAAEPTSPTTPLRSQPPAPPAPNRGSVLLPMERQLSADDLMALWGRVGVQVCEIATSMFEKSRKSVVGDGTYAGFIQTVLACVPNAAPAPTPTGEYGYLVYAQNGPSVQKRISDIMPGDIVEIVDAKLKGHKGLQTYHQSVGIAGSEPLVGVVGEFEPKKSKIRVFHANQHVGQQSVESVSYRLEDVKSGLIKVYRVCDV